MSDRKIPLGISVITILMYIGAIIDIAAALFLFLETSEVASAADVTESQITGIAIGLLVVGLVIGLLAMGLRKASNGVRLVIAAVLILRIAGAIYIMFAFPGARFEGLVAAMIGAVILYFLYGTDDAKAFFGDTPAMG